MKKTFLFIALIATSYFAEAGVIVVDSINDAGTGSLRDAIAAANEGDTIRFNPNLIATGSDTIKLANEIAFNKGLVFKGLYNTIDTLLISGQNAVRIFNVNLSSASNKVIVIDSLVLINGNPSSGNGGGINFLDGDSLVISHSTISGNSANNGGAVYSFSFSNTSSVAISNSTISGNSANVGGGVSSSSFSSSSSLTVSNSKILGNLASIGGGLYSFSSDFNSFVTVSNSTISGNSASNGGGGIYSYSSNFNSFVIVSNSTISENSASNVGGGVYSYSSGANSVTVSNSTISGNSASAGGGVYSSSNSSSVTVTNSTISGNSAGDGGGIFSSSQTTDSLIVSNSTISGNSSSYNGGGIYSFSSNYDPVIITKGSIIAFNGSNNIYNSNSTTINSTGYNIFSDALVTGSIASDILGVSLTQLNLDTLKNNGGTTKTLKPLCGSFAINAGDPSDITTAQNGSLIGVRDIGATESDEPALVRDTVTDVIACGNYIWSVNGNNYTNSGVYNDTVSCDTIKTLNLTINQTYNDTLLVAITICSNDSAQLFGTWRNTAGFYVDSNTTVNGCDSITTQELIVLPVATTSVSQNVCNGDSVQIGGNWYSTPQTVYDTVFNGAANGCDSIVTHVLQSCVGIDDLTNLTLEFNIYPNPAQQNITVNINNNQEVNTTLEIFNITGKVMHKQNINTAKSTEINIENYTKGIYFIKLTANNKSVTKKLVVN